VFCSSVCFFFFFEEVVLVELLVDVTGADTVFLVLVEVESLLIC